MTAVNPTVHERNRMCQILRPAVAGLTSPFRGTRDAVHKNLDLIERHKPDFVTVFAADPIYRMDVRQMIDFIGATMRVSAWAVVRVPIEEAGRFGRYRNDGEWS